jgi:hypothetical protein
MSPDELVELFGALGRLKISLCAAVDERLQREHDLPLASFDAMKVIAGFAEGCDLGALADSLAVSLHEADAIIESLVATGHAFRKPPAGASGAGPVALTLPGALVLKQAEQMVERVLHAQLDAILSPADQRLLQEALRALRLRDTSLTADAVADFGSSGVP